MEHVWQTLATAFIAWMAYNFVAIPFLKFRDLRAEVRRNMVLYANVQSRWKETKDGDLLPASDVEMKPAAERHLEEAEVKFRELASEMRSFADTNSLPSWVLTKFGFNVRAASSGLFGISNTLDTSGPGKLFQKQTLEKALKFRDS